ncbi:MAG: ROK family protein, partial [Ilumatobacteraceae bacterium]
VHYSPNIRCLVHYPLASTVAAGLGHRVVMGNDANAACWAEYRIGAGRGVDDVLLVTLGTGIGTGMIVGGRLVEGAHGFAGESGHMVIDQHGRAHHTGQHGPWEMTASGTALMGHARSAVGSGELQLHSDLSPTAFATALANGDVAALAIVDEVAAQVALGCANLIMVLDPARIVIGGGLSSLGEPLRAAIDRHIASTVLGAQYRPAVEVVLATLGDDAGAVGAALWARDAQEKFSK